MRIIDVKTDYDSQKKNSERVVVKSANDESKERDNKKVKKAKKA